MSEAEFEAEMKARLALKYGRVALSVALRSKVGEHKTAPGTRTSPETALTRIRVREGERDCRISIP